MKFLLILIAFCVVTFSNAQISSYEKQALLDFYDSTNGSNWLISWDLNSPVETWQGVEIINNQVVGIELGFNNLQGYLPETISNLENLQYLKLFFNQLTGELPGGIGLLKKLKVLDLNSNFMVGKIPNEIGELSQLEELLLSSNNFTGILPDSLSQLTQLKSLVLFDNHFYGEFPMAVTKLNQLEYLIIAQNNFNHEIIHEALAILNSKGTQIDFNELKLSLQPTDVASSALEDDH